MTREIKFRAWAKGDKVMVDSMTLNNTQFLGVNFATIDSNLIIMQYTGLKDKNGKEIYEGDILKYRNIIKEVKWYKRNIHFEFSPHPDIEDYKLNAWHNLFEIIGNIYENKELLEDDK